MLTYSFETIGSESMYEYLYHCIKKDILQKKLKPDEKLPSKRAFAKNLGVSIITIENAYAQLAAEGYIYTLPKRGYFVANLEGQTLHPLRERQQKTQGQKQKNEPAYYADFVRNSVAPDSFPFSVWTKLLRDVTDTESEASLLSDTSVGGVMKLRQALAEHLYQFRGLSVEPEQIIVGAGTQYLYSVLIQLLGRNRSYAVEDPGYPRLMKIYESNDVTCHPIPMDPSGIIPDYIKSSGAQILHITPSHHFPTGIVMPVSRRYELLSWAAQQNEHYIIEDDYDCEFRLFGKPIPTLQSIDIMEKVIYINTFSKSLAPTFRISYMVLPRHLVERYYERLGFYSCTVSTFEQFTLARFISEGYFEKHINRMRTYYRKQRDTILKAIRQSDLCPYVTIREEDSGLHFLMKIHTQIDDAKLILAAKNAGIRISCVSQYYHDNQDHQTHEIILNYSGIEPDKINTAIQRLSRSLLAVILHPEDAT
ncbi:transcriptional regulator with HTH domain and aminotransferase domain [Desulfitobacterium dichloroeliminans LMG P-21439]|uniref:Transcriptional regulator with HTH domain and aminotransferase domain n=1 Tax=Desulfitobacterium dichloroeliminans (strain LMG P-21439 / DCA1) TaxID=871963 RepID=L0F6T9_DESDL|nr:PLP-dependent aminotransferase family protein [Desulfitobacterium dichloroeliminans]AGA68376.1 transcriptional regulator with HTH domain and aminotransferase domain [Desulfitobacterium dichloroeliminans LMG P-21439]